MDRFKNNIGNVIFSNKTQFLKNRRQGNISSNANSNLTFNGMEYTPITILLVILLIIIAVFIS